MPAPSDPAENVAAAEKLEVGLGDELKAIMV